MTAEQLEELLRKVTHNIKHVSTKYQHKTYHDIDISGGGTLRDIGEPLATLISLAPSLARRVIAAERLLKLVELVHGSFGGGLTMTFDHRDPEIFADALTAYRESCK